MKFSDVPIGARFKWVKTSEESLKVTFDTFYDPTEDELFCISGSNLYKTDEDVELLTKCENCIFKEKHKHTLTKRLVNTCIQNDNKRYIKMLILFHALFLK